MVRGKHSISCVARLVKHSRNALYSGEFFLEVTPVLATLMVKVPKNKRKRKKEKAVI